jgi:hypothetical protein
MAYLKNMMKNLTLKAEKALKYSMVIILIIITIHTFITRKQMVCAVWTGIILMAVVNKLQAFFVDREYVIVVPDDYLMVDKPRDVEPTSVEHENVEPKSVDKPRDVDADDDWMVVDKPRVVDDWMVVDEADDCEYIGGSIDPTY